MDSDLKPLLREYIAAYNKGWPFTIDYYNIDGSTCIVYLEYPSSLPSVMTVNLWDLVLYINSKIK